MTDKEEMPRLGLLNFFKLLWQGKFVILICLTSSILFAVASPHYSASRSYSDISYVQNHIPSFLARDVVQNNIEQIFYSEQTFSKWSDEVSPHAITFVDISKNKTFRGGVFRKNDSERLVTFRRTRPAGGILVVASDDVKVIEEILSYFYFVNIQASEQHAQLVEQEITNFHKYLNVSTLKIDSLGEADILRSFMTFKRYLDHHQNGAAALIIDRPSIPENISFKSKIFSWSIVFGLFVGICVVAVGAKFRRVVKIF